MIRHDLPNGTIHEGDWLQADLVPGYSLAIIDGPYAMGKAGWDRMGIDGLAAWYEPHIARVSELCAPSASVYLWNTAEGWARLDPVMRAAGWTFRALVTWDKGIGFLAGKIDTNAARAWPDVTEVCALYQREGWTLSGGAGATIAAAANADPRNEAAAFLAAEREAAGMTRRDLAAWFPSASGRLTGCVSNWEGGQNFPTMDVWEKAAAAMQTASPRADGERPYLVLPGFWPVGGLAASYDHLRASYDHLRAEYDHLRAEYEASRPWFDLPPGLTNIWSAPLVAGVERVKGPDGTPLHPCQKPLLFAERMVRASSRPGERVLAPFGGTCREAVICEWLARTDPAQARRYDVCELNQDGVDYIGPVLAQIQGRDVRPRDKRQALLFGEAAK